MKGIPIPEFPGEERGQITITTLKAMTEDVGINHFQKSLERDLPIIFIIILQIDLLQDHVMSEG